MTQKLFVEQKSYMLILGDLLRTYWLKWEMKKTLGKMNLVKMCSVYNELVLERKK